MPRPHSSDRPSRHSEHPGADPKAKALRARWRQAASQALMDAGMIKDASKLHACGEQIGQVRTCPVNPDHQAALLMRTCHLRICPDCNSRRRFQMTERYLRPALQARLNRVAGYGFRHVVFTTQHQLYDADTRDRLKEGWIAIPDAIDDVYYQTFKNELTAEERHRGKLDWKQRQLGYLGAAEFGYTGLKLHYHVLLFGPFLDQAALAKAWKMHMGAHSHIVDIEFVPPSASDIEDVLTYVAKLTTLEAQHAPQLLKVIEGVRLLKSKGLFYGLGKQFRKPQHCPHCNATLVNMTPRVAEYLYRENRRIAQLMAGATPRFT